MPGLLFYHGDDGGGEILKREGRVFFFCRRDDIITNYSNLKHLKSNLFLHTAAFYAIVAVCLVCDVNNQLFQSCRPHFLCVSTCPAAFVPPIFFSFLFYWAPPTIPARQAVANYILFSLDTQAALQLRLPN